MRSEVDLDILNVLPTEIILHIFSFAVATTFSWNGKLDFTGRLNPLRLGHICSTWRTIVWDTPWFWTSIELKFHVFCAISYRDQVRLVEEWLERTKDWPLSIRFFPGRETDPPWRQNSPIELLNIITSHSKKWEHLEIDIPSSWYKHFSNLQAPGQLPLLKTLFIEKAQRELAPIEIFNNATALQNIHLFRIHMVTYRPTTSTLLDLKWDRLKHFTATYFTVHEFHLLLSLCPNLLSCKIIELEGRTGVRRRVEAPNIKELILLRCRGSFVIVSALEPLRCPSLRTLRLSRAVGATNSNIPLQTLVQPWRCNLTTLSLGRIRLPETALIPFLRDAQPGIRRLSLIEIMGPAVDWEEEWAGISELLHTSSLFLPELEFWNVGEFHPELTYGKSFGPPMDVVQRIRAFRDGSDFPSKEMGKRLEIIVGGVSELRWAGDIS